MTIDERLERLAERHEALAQSLELMQHMWEQRWTAAETRLDKITTAIAQDAENIRGLVRIAELHHERISRLEGQPPA